MSKKPYVPAEMLTKLWRAMIEFDMIQEGDKILIGLSGGKDSQFMTVAGPGLGSTVLAILIYTPIRWTECSPRIFPKRNWRTSVPSTALNIIPTR